MNCIIVDDEPLAREEMRNLIQEVSEIAIIGDFSNAPSALDFIKNNEVNLVFLDIQMPKVTGLEFGEQVPERTLIVFTTAYSKYAVRSYELGALDYLLKPIDKERLLTTINKALAYTELLSRNTVKNEIEGTTSDFLLIKADKRFYRINLKDIRYIEGLKDYVVIHTQNQKLITAMNLKTIHQRISSELFIRVSKSYIVNMNFVESFNHHTIYMGETEIPLGEIYKDNFFKEYSSGFFL